MSSQTQRAVTDFIQDQTIIDVDVHLGKALTYDIVSEYLDEPHYSRLMNSTGSSPLPYSGWDRSSGENSIAIDGHTKHPRISWRYTGISGLITRL